MEISLVIFVCVKYDINRHGSGAGKLFSLPAHVLGGNTTRASLVLTLQHCSGMKPMTFYITAQCTGLRWQRHQSPPRHRDVWSRRQSRSFPASATLQRGRELHQAQQTLTSHNLCSSAIRQEAPECLKRPTRLLEQLPPTGYKLLNSWLWLTAA